jgi:ABC-type uncharacterized transport system permease subunit
MAELESIVDSTYRWTLVVLMGLAFAACLIPGAYNKGFPKRPPLQMMYGALVLIVAGIVLAPIFGEPIIDAALLRARFGFMVPDTHPHGYGWALVFGYAWGLASVVLFLLGTSYGRSR